jgi:GrpB-like predicted nucleotidyltransferase (UPF0157 family)
MHGDPNHLDDELDTVLIGGREPVAIELVEYDPAWPARFVEVRARLSDALGPVARRVEHVGSTAVPGLCAKPIIDVLVEVDDPDDDGRFVPAVEGAGFVLRVREPGHRMFRTPSRDVHVHVWRAGGREAADYLILRDWLRSSEVDRALYAASKRALAGRRWPDMSYYAEAKGPVIEEIYERAVRARTGPPASAA